MVKSWQNHAATLKCAANANPAATFAWYKDDRPISSGFSSEHDASTLTLMPNTTGDFGIYACKVMNSQGTTWHNVTLEQLCKLRKSHFDAKFKRTQSDQYKKKRKIHTHSQKSRISLDSIKGELLNHHYWNIRVYIYIYIYIYIRVIGWLMPLKQCSIHF